MIAIAATEGVADESGTHVVTCRNTLGDTKVRICV